MADANTGRAVLDASAKRVSEKMPKFPRVWLNDAEPAINNEYLVKGIIDRGKLTVIYGPSGDGKTFFTADMVSHVAAGIVWRGRRVRKGLVVYVAAEAGASILRRFYAWRETKLGETREERVPLAVITRGVNLLNLVEVDELLLELQNIATEAGMSLVLVIFDTLSRSMPGGDENSSQDVTQVIAAADRVRDELGAGTVIIHHAGKDTKKGARGHSSLCAAADTVIEVVDQVATIEKARDGTTGERFAFDLDIVDLGTDADGDTVTTCVVRPTEAGAAKSRGVPLTGVGIIALQALQEAVTDQGEAMPGTSTIPPGVRAVTMECWRHQFRLRYGTDPEGGERDRDAIRKAFRRALEQLAKANRIGISDPYVWETR